MIPLKQYDTARAISDALQIDSAAIDLTGATVTALWSRPDGVVYERAATIVSAVAGTVTYTPVAADVAIAGSAALEWRINYPGTRLTVPTVAPIPVTIYPALA